MLTVAEAREIVVRGVAFELAFDVLALLDRFLDGLQSPQHRGT
jgi:hypothetical protein